MPPVDDNTQRMIDAVAARKKASDERLAEVRERQAKEAEQSIRTEERLRRANGAYHQRTEMRANLGVGAAGFAHTFGSLPFVGGLSRIIGGGLASAQVKDAAAMAQVNAGKAATRAATSQTRAGTAAEAGGMAMAKGAALFNPVAAAVVAGMEFVKYGLGGVAKFSPATQERLQYQQDRLQAGVGSLFTPLVQGLTKRIEKTTDTLFGKGFQLNHPQISSSAADVRDRLQLTAAQGTTPVNTPSAATIVKALGEKGGIGRDLLAILGGAGGLAVAEMLDSGGAGSWGAQLGRWANQGFRSEIKVFE